MTERERIGKMVAEMRNSKGYTIRELAGLCGVSYQNITKIENGRYNVSIDILSKVANTLGYEISFEERSDLKQFVIDNQDRDDIIGDLCKDLLTDNNFLLKKSEKEQREYILRLPILHHCVTDAVNDLFMEYSGEIIKNE